MELLMVLILGAATQGLGQNGGGCFGCVVVFQPLPCSILAAGLFVCTRNRATSMFTAWFSASPCLVWCCIGGCARLSVGGLFWQSTTATLAKPGLVEPVRPSPAWTWWSQPRFLSPSPTSIAGPCRPGLTSCQEDGEGLSGCKKPGNKKRTFSSFLLS